MVKRQDNNFSLKSSFRVKRFQKFIDILSISSTDEILDVGGSPEIWDGSGFEKNVTILNKNLPQDRSSAYNWVDGDACNMYKFANQSFDVVFSNSVIEHVGELNKQQEMASEIKRVGKKYWIQTPYKHFPIEIHFLFPFFQYLSKEIQLFLARKWPFSYAKNLNLDPEYEVEHIWLLDYKNISGLFPECDILKERFYGITKSLIAVGL